MKQRSGEAYGPGGQGALDKNPNDHPELNSAPEGPFPHVMGQSDDGGMQGKESVSARGGTFHFK